MKIHCFLQGRKFWRVIALMTDTSYEAGLRSYRMVALAKMAPK